jgi:hypothetical protein
MASFWQDPIGWLGNERDRAATLYYSPNPEAKAQAIQTPSGQQMGGAPGGFWGAPQANPFEAAVDKGIAASRPDVNGPFGNTDWTKNADGTWSMSQGFNGLLGGAAQGLQGQLAESLSSPFMTGDQARQQAIDSAYGQAKSRLDPMFQQREDAMKSQLVNQGLDPTSEAYANALENFGRERNDAYSSAMNGAIGQGTMAGQAVFGQNMQARQAPLQSLLSMQGLLPGAPQGGGGNYVGALQASNAYGDPAQRQFMDFLQGGVGLAGQFLK